MHLVPAPAVRLMNEFSRIINRWCRNPLVNLYPPVTAVAITRKRCYQRRHHQETQEQPLCGSLSGQWLAVNSRNNGLITILAPDAPPTVTMTSCIRCDHVIHLVVRALTYRTGNRRRVEGSLLDGGHVSAVTVVSLACHSEESIHTACNHDSTIVSRS